MKNVRKIFIFSFFGFIYFFSVFTSSSVALAEQMYLYPFASQTIVTGSSTLDFIELSATSSVEVVDSISTSTVDILSSYFPSSVATSTYYSTFRSKFTDIVSSFSSSLLNLGVGNSLAQYGFGQSFTPATTTLKGIGFSTKKIGTGLSWNVFITGNNSGVPDMSTIYASTTVALSSSGFYDVSVPVTLPSLSVKWIVLTPVSTSSSNYNQFYYNDIADYYSGGILQRRGFDSSTSNLPYDWAFVTYVATSTSSDILSSYSPSSINYTSTDIISVVDTSDKVVLDNIVYNSLITLDSFAMASSSMYLLTGSSSATVVDMASTTVAVNSVNFGLAIIIVLLFIIICGFIFNNMDKKPIQKKW